MGDGGWVRFGSLRDDVVARVRFVIREDGRLEPAEVHIDGPDRLTGDTLRKLPLGHIEAFANGSMREEFVERINAGATKVEKATDRWLTAVDGPQEMNVRVDTAIRRVRRQALTLRVPNDLKKPDAFYQRVADLYTMLADSGSRRPAQEIADANEDIEVSTVHRWVKEARRRRLLGSGRRGKAG
jgi:hypothetical protein